MSITVGNLESVTATDQINLFGLTQDWYGHMQNGPYGIIIYWKNRNIDVTLNITDFLAQGLQSGRILA